MNLEGQGGQQFVAEGAHNNLRLGRLGALVTTELHGRYFEQARYGNVFIAQAIVTAPVIYTTAAGTGGPLLWNPPTSGVNCALLAASVGVTVVTTVAAALGITGNSGQTSAPTSTTAIDGKTNAIIGNTTSRATAFRVGTVANAGNFLLPFAALHTGALTVDNTSVAFVDLGGLIIVPPGSWASIAASATATTTVATLGLVWEEVTI